MPMNVMFMEEHSLMSDMSNIVHPSTLKSIVEEMVSIAIEQVEKTTLRICCSVQIV